MFLHLPEVSGVQLMSHSSGFHLLASLLTFSLWRLLAYQCAHLPLDGGRDKKERAETRVSCWRPGEPNASKLDASQGWAVGTQAKYSSKLATDEDLSSQLSSVPFVYTAHFLAEIVSRCFSEAEPLGKASWSREKPGAELGWQAGRKIAARFACFLASWLTGVKELLNREVKPGESSLSPREENRHRDYRGKGRPNNNRICGIDREEK